MIAYLQYLIVRGFSFIVNLLPENLSLWLGRLLGRLAFHLDWEHQKVALHNLQIAFGQEKRERELRAIAKRAFQNLGMTTVEFFRIPRMDLENFKKKVTVEGLENVKELLEKREKGALLFFPTLAIGN